MEAEGRKCFDNLAMRSLFQDFEHDFDVSIIKRCKMHDLVHDFVQLLTLNEFSTVTMKENIAQKEDLMIHTRHLTLVLSSDSEGQITELSILKKMKNLRTHVVRSFNTDKIGPEHISTIGNLYNLQTLILRSCGDPEAFEGLPKEIGKLGNLWMLSLEFGISHNSDKFQLRDLSKLNNLRNLDIRRSEESGHTGGPMLNENRILYSLEPSFSPSGEKRAAQENALEAFQRYPNLQYLGVVLYCGHCSPNCVMTLANLKT
ncbi:hypothetical protein L484_014884 [Morus notabilis]|uniref:Disease resistance protein winged helix domain-containing protein n=1 Tax=Morus notabilis TaxID=981085 RepID=W9S221_9ROSA|nr:hypothetical protein L484_014884 [Morus notabilis]